MSEDTDDTTEEPSLEGLPKPGELIADKYRIDRLIGQGGMGAVFVANHELLHQPVAVKLLLPEVAEIPEAVARFTNEARASARIRNEHVAQVMDVGKLENGSAYMVLEYLDGSDLADLLDKNGALPISDAVDYVLQGLEAVAQAHALGIIHRDLKPANLFLARRQDGSKIIKVLDFGISKATNPLAGQGQMTSTKALLGSPGYMSPEQVRSSKHVDVRTDIWSMGVILYRLLTDVAPFDGPNLGAVFAAILEEDPPKVRHWRAEIPEGLEAVVCKCLERNRDKRYQNAAELACALAPFADLEASLAADRICRTLGVVPTHRSARHSRPEDSGARPALEPSGARPFPEAPRATPAPPEATTAPAPAVAPARPAPPASTAATQLADAYAPTSPEQPAPQIRPPTPNAGFKVTPMTGPAGTVVMTPGQPLLPPNLATPKADEKPAPKPVTTPPPRAPMPSAPGTGLAPAPAAAAAPAKPAGPAQHAAPPPPAKSGSRGAIIAVAIAALIIGTAVGVRAMLAARDTPPPAPTAPSASPSVNPLPEIPPRPAGGPGQAPKPQGQPVVPGAQ